VVEHWSELDDVRCEVDDLTFRHVAGDVLEPDLPDGAAVARDADLESGAARRRS
jgi:hypothetical protein